MPEKETTSEELEQPTKQTKTTSIFDLDEEIDAVLAGKANKKEEVLEKDEKSEKEEEELSAMAKLLKDNTVRAPQVGDKIKGKVIGVESLSVLVDLGGLGTGIIYGKDIKNGFGADRRKLEIGEEINSMIVDIENEDGYIELSISEAVREEAWKDLEKKRSERTLLQTRILEANKGGLLVEVNGIRGFMPVSQLSAEHYPRVDDGDKSKILEILRSYVGTEMNVCVLDVNEKEEKLIVSEKQAHHGKEREAVAQLKVGEIIEGQISGIVDFGAFVKFLPGAKKDSEKEEDKLEGLVHISQLDWQLIEDPRKLFKVGDKVKAKIIAIDDTRISLSIRQLKNDPWAEIDKKYQVGSIFLGKVNRINHFGAFVYLDKDIHGLAHVSGFPGYPHKKLDQVIKIDGEYAWEIMSMEANEHRMGLKYAGEAKDLEKIRQEKQQQLEEKEKSKEEASLAGEKKEEATADSDKNEGVETKEAKGEEKEKTEKKAKIKAKKEKEEKVDDEKEKEKKAKKTKKG